jgi:hypothetical protein
MGKDLEGSGHGLIEVLSRNSPGVTEENHEKTPVRIAGVPAVLTRAFRDFPQPV